MRSLGITISIVLWMFITIIMVITVIGMIPFLITDEKINKCYWFEILETLINKY